MFLHVHHISDVIFSVCFDMFRFSSFFIFPCVVFNFLENLSRRTTLYVSIVLLNCHGHDFGTRDACRNRGMIRFPLRTAQEIPLQLSEPSLHFADCAHLQSRWSKVRSIADVEEQLFLFIFTLYLFLKTKLFFLIHL